MARVTVEDCLVRIPNAFSLTQVAAKRARQLARGAVSQMAIADHKVTVQALREIATGSVTASILDEADLPLPEQSGPDLGVLES